MSNTLGATRICHHEELSAADGRNQEYHLEGHEEHEEEEWKDSHLVVRPLETGKEAFWADMGFSIELSRLGNG